MLHDPAKVHLPSADAVPPALRKLAGEHDKLVVAASEAATDHRRAEQALPGAEAADQAAFARALRAGKADPGTPATAKAREAIAQAKRHAGAAAQAAEEAAVELQNAIVANRAQWLERLEGEQDERRRALADVVDQLARARAELVNVDSTAAWLRQFPSRRGPRGGTPPVRTLVGANGSAVQWGRLLDALRTEAVPPLEPVAGEPSPAA